MFLVDYFCHGLLGHAVSLLRNCCLYVLAPRRYRALAVAARRVLEGPLGD